MLTELIKDNDKYKEKGEKTEEKQTRVKKFNIKIDNLCNSEFLDFLEL